MVSTGNVFLSTCSFFLTTDLLTMQSWYGLSPLVNAKSNTYLINSNNFLSDTLIFLAKFHDKWSIGTIDLKFCILFHSYLSIASWYCLAVNGPTFQAMLLHHPTAWTQWTHPAFTHTKSPGRCKKRYTGILASYKSSNIGHQEPWR